MPFFHYPITFDDPIIAEKEFISPSRYTLISTSDPIRGILDGITSLDSFCEADFPQYAFWAAGKHMLMYSAAILNKKRSIETVIVLRLHVTPESVSKRMTFPRVMTFHVEYLKGLLKNRPKIIELRSINTLDGGIRYTSNIAVNDGLFELLYVTHRGYMREPFLHVPHFTDTENRSIHRLVHSYLEYLHTVDESAFISDVASSLHHLGSILHAFDYLRDQFRFPHHEEMMSGLCKIHREHKDFDTEELSLLRSKYTVRSEI
jgi:hypothetical protein